MLARHKCTQKGEGQRGPEGAGIAPCDDAREIEAAHQQCHGGKTDERIRAAAHAPPERNACGGPSNHIQQFSGQYRRKY